MKMPKKTTGPVSETQMISLADIAFLIIFFFMLTSQFMSDKIAVPLPTVPDAAKTKAPNTVTLNGQKQIFFNSLPMANKDELEASLKSKLEGKTQEKDLEVRFKCDKNLTFKDYKAVFEAIGNAGGIIAVMHDLPSKKQE